MPLTTLMLLFFVCDMFNAMNNTACLELGEECSDNSMCCDRASCRHEYCQLPCSAFECRARCQHCLDQYLTCEEACSSCWNEQAYFCDIAYGYKSAKQCRKMQSSPWAFSNACFKPSGNICRDFKCLKKKLFKIKTSASSKWLGKKLEDEMRASFRKLIKNRKRFNSMTQTAVTLHCIRESSTFWEEFIEKRPFVLSVKNTRDVRCPWQDILHLFDAGLRQGPNVRFLDPRTSPGQIFTFMRDVSLLDNMRIDRSTGLDLLNRSTMVIHGSFAVNPGVSQLAIEISEAFHAPLVGINTYVTPQNLYQSAPLHTDKTDIFIVQSSGEKLWKVFAPNENEYLPIEDIGMHTRGKSGEILTLEEVGSELLNTKLKVGDILFLPRGFPHATSTFELKGKDPSVHHTVSLVASAKQLTYDKIARCVVGISVDRCSDTSVKPCELLTDMVLITRKSPLWRRHFGASIYSLMDSRWTHPIVNDIAELLRNIPNLDVNYKVLEVLQELVEELRLRLIKAEKDTTRYTASLSSEDSESEGDKVSLLPVMERFTRNTLDEYKVYPDKCEQFIVPTSISNPDKEEL